MTAQRIDGRKIATQLRQSITQEVTNLPSQPGLAVILVGDDPASQIYVAKKIKTTEEVGIVSIEKRLPETATESDVATVIRTLNNDKAVHGILLQLPLPKHLDSDKLIQMIDPAKDVDGLTYHNIARLVTNEDGLVPCTPQGSLKLIQSVKKDLTGLHAVVIGRSLLFGKPMAQLLLQQNCTVTIAHSKTTNLKDICKQADILIAAVGQPKLVKGDWIKSGAIIIDVGINRLDDNSICGDIDFEAAKETALAITPVPGGVGPMTIACLLANTLKAYKTTL